MLVKSYSCCTSNLLVALSYGVLKVGQLQLISILFHIFFYLQVEISGFFSWSMRTLQLKPLLLDLEWPGSTIQTVVKYMCVRLCLSARTSMHVWCVRVCYL